MPTPRSIVPGPGPDAADHTRPLTRLLQAWRGGDQAALDEMLPLVESELKRIARGLLRRERAGHTLQTTAIVNEAYLRLVDERAVDWQGRSHFFGIAARTMRRILVDHARKRRATKRGGSDEELRLDDVLEPGTRGLDPAEVIAVNDALERLEALDPRQARVVELRVFAGLLNPEVAAVLGISRATVKREWEAARAWLHRELTG